MDLIFAPGGIGTWSLDWMRSYDRKAKQHGAERVPKTTASMGNFGCPDPRWRLCFRLRRR